MPRCPTHANIELEPKKKGWYCEECDCCVASYEDVPLATEVVSVGVDEVPFPVAYPLVHARDTSLPAGRRMNNAIFAAYQAVRTTALLLLADYLNVETASGRLAQPIRGLRLPHWGEWSRLCDQLSSFWLGRFPETSERPTAFPQLAEGWQIVNGSRACRSPPWKQMLDGCPGLSGPARNPNDFLWKLRNDRAHRMGTQTLDEREEQSTIGRVLEIIEAMVAQLFPRGGLTLVRTRPGATPDLEALLKLHGAPADLKFVELPLESCWRDALSMAPVAAIGDDRVLSLGPLFLPGEELDGRTPITSGGADSSCQFVEPVTMIDGVKQKTVVVLGVRQHGESSSHAATLRAALARKHVELGLGRDEVRRWTLADWSCTTAREAIEALRGSKYLPECYVERAGVDNVVEECLAQSGALLLLGEAGTGKTSLITRLVEALITQEDGEKDDEGSPEESGRARGERSDVVLFLSGRGAYAGDAGMTGRALLCEAIARRAGIRAGEFGDLADLIRSLEATSAQDQNSERRLWIVLDALNEADRFSDLVTALDDVLPVLTSLPWVRLLVSMRAGAYFALRDRRAQQNRHGADVFSNPRCFASFHDEREDKEVPYFLVRPFSQSAEGKRAYELRRERLPERSCAVPYESLDSGVRRLLLTPLLLHIFHEAHRGVEELPRQGLGESELLGSYLDKLAQDVPGLATTLTEVGRVVFDTGKPEVPAQTADEWVSAWRQRIGYESASQVARLDPIEELVSASLVLPPAARGLGWDDHAAGYQFSHQRLCEQILLRELRRQIAPRPLPSGEELAAWASRAARFPELLGALELLVRQMVDAGDGVGLAALLEVDDSVVRTSLLSEALCAAGERSAEPKAAKVIRVLMLAPMEVEQALRLDAAARQARSWLVQTGASAGAAVLDNGRLRLARKWHEEHPDRVDLKTVLAGALMDLGKIARYEGRSEKAEEHAQEALEILDGLAAEAPDGELHWLQSVVLSDLGKLARAAGGSERAGEYFRRSLEAIERAIQCEPSCIDYKRDLAIALCDEARVLVNQQILELAEDRITRSLEILEELLAAEPAHVGLQADLAAMLSVAGKLALKRGRELEADKSLARAVELMRALEAAQPYRSDLNRELARALSNYASLPIPTTSVKLNVPAEPTEGARAATRVAPQTNTPKKATHERRLELRARIGNRSMLGTHVAPTHLPFPGPVPQPVASASTRLSLLKEAIARESALVQREPQRIDLLRDFADALMRVRVLVQINNELMDWQEMVRSSEVFTEAVAADGVPLEFRTALFVHLAWVHKELIFFAPALNCRVRQMLVLAARSELRRANQEESSSQSLNHAIGSAFAHAVSESASHEDERDDALTLARELVATWRALGLESCQREGDTYARSVETWLGQFCEALVTLAGTHWTESLTLFEDTCDVLRSAANAAKVQEEVVWFRRTLATFLLGLSRTAMNADQRELATRAYAELGQRCGDGGCPSWNERIVREAVSCGCLAYAFATRAGNNEQSEACLQGLSVIWNLAQETATNRDAVSYELEARRLARLAEGEGLPSHAEVLCLASLRWRAQQKRYDIDCVLALVDAGCEAACDGDTSLAADYFDRASCSWLQVPDVTRDDDVVAALVALSEFHTQQGRPSDALRLLTDAQMLQDARAEGHVQLRSLVYFGRRFLEASNPDAARCYCHCLLPKLGGVGSELPQDARIVWEYAREGLHEGDLHACLDLEQVLLVCSPQEMRSLIAALRARRHKDDEWTGLDSLSDAVVPTLAIAASNCWKREWRDEALVLTRRFLHRWEAAGYAALKTTTWRNEFLQMLASMVETLPDSSETPWLFDLFHRLLQEFGHDKFEAASWLMVLLRAALKGDRLQIAASAFASLDDCFKPEECRWEGSLVREAASCGVPAYEYAVRSGAEADAQRCLDTLLTFWTAAARDATQADSASYMAQACQLASLADEAGFSPQAGTLRQASNRWKSKSEFEHVFSKWLETSGTGSRLDLPMLREFTRFALAEGVAADERECLTQSFRLVLRVSSDQSVNDQLADACVEGLLALDATERTGTQTGDAVAALSELRSLWGTARKALGDGESKLAREFHRRALWAWLRLPAATLLGMADRLAQDAEELTALSSQLGWPRIAALLREDERALNWLGHRSRNASALIHLGRRFHSALNLDVAFNCCQMLRPLMENRVREMLASDPDDEAFTVYQRALRAQAAGEYRDFLALCEVLLS